MHSVRTSLRSGLQRDRTGEGSGTVEGEFPTARVTRGSHRPSLPPTVRGRAESRDGTLLPCPRGGFHDGSGGSYVKTGRGNSFILCTLECADPSLPRWLRWPSAERWRCGGCSCWQAPWRRRMMRWRPPGRARAWTPRTRSRGPCSRRLAFGERAADCGTLWAVHTTVVDAQRSFFDTGWTVSPAVRRQSLVCGGISTGARYSVGSRQLRRACRQRQKTLHAPTSTGNAQKFQTAEVGAIPKEKPRKLE